MLHRIFKTKKITVQKTNIQVIPRIQVLLDGCYTDNIYKCDNCSSIQYIKHNGIIQCSICNCYELIRFDAIYQWVNHHWEYIMEYIREIE